MIEYCGIIQDEVNVDLEQLRIENCDGTKPHFICDHADICSINVNYCSKFRKLLNLEPIDDDTF